MQCVSRSVRAQPFTRAASKPCTVRPVSVRPSNVRSVVARAASVADDYLDDLDVVVNNSAPLPLVGEKARLRIRMRSYEVSLLKECVAQVMAVADATGAVFKGPVMLPTKKRVYCVLRSPHVDKDAREHFEIRTHHRLVDLQNLSAETVAAMMQWVPPSGVEVECSIA